MHKRINSLNSLVAIFTIVILLVGCNDSSNSIARTFNRDGQEIRLTVTTVKTNYDMKSKVWKFKEGMQGQALYSPSDNKCEIVIYEPKGIDDEATLTLGHELMHCLYGDYHD